MLSYNIMINLDYLITGARIIDPESGADFYGAAAVAGDKIAALYPGDAPAVKAARVIDAAGGLLVPGFIDPHAHTDNSQACAEKLLAMGVTSAYSGNCGMSPPDLGAFFAGFEERGYPVNQAEQAGQSTLRRAAGQEDAYAPASPAQIRKMKDLAREAFDAGAAGLSFGLEYNPGTEPEELRALADCAFAAGKAVSIHARASTPEASILEALELCRGGGRVIISHLVYMYSGDGLKRVLELIAGYRARGADVWADSGMYTAFSTLAGSAVFDKVNFARNNFNVNLILAATGKYAGQYLDTKKFQDILEHFPGDSLIYDLGGPEDVLTAYSLPEVMVSTDCMGYPPGQGHPQGAATYPLFFRSLVKEGAGLSLLDALRRCTSIPAKALGYTDRGRVAPGAYADLVVLDWERLRERADFPNRGDPGAAPEGVRHVFVNGQLAVEDERRVPGVLAGRRL
ncbi:MAG: amidohydrolase family protein [Treponema sp.]|jgi:N-acyl-D-amino-acid deacylase|nr:amidohydrolase family protein [Treponema sp.]